MPALFSVRLTAASECSAAVSVNDLDLKLFISKGAANFSLKAVILVLNFASLTDDERFKLCALNFSDASVLFILSFKIARSCDNTACIAGSVVLVSASL